MATALGVNEFDINEIAEQTSNLISDVEKNNAVLKGLKYLRSENKLETVSKKCRDIQEEYDKLNSELETQEEKNYLNERKKTLESEYADKIQAYLQHEMNVTFDRKDRDGRGTELAGVLLYCLRIGEPDPFVQNIIKRIIWHAPHAINYDWFEFLCYVVLDDMILTPLFQMLSNLPTGTLHVLLMNNSKLLFTKESYLLLYKLKARVSSFKQLIQTFMSVRDENGRTHMFHTKTHLLYDSIFSDHEFDLYELLSVQDINGQTAVHANTLHVREILLRTYKPKHRQDLISLMSITDINGLTALDMSDWWDSKLSWLIEQVEKNRYVLYTGPATVLIIYTTHNRKNAEEEAFSIYNAFKSLLAYKTHIERNKTKDEILELIEQSAKETDHVYGSYRSALLVILMSHGSIGFIEDAEKQPVSFAMIEEAMCKEPKLKDRPKILITQCCQNQLKNLDDAPAYVPKSAHFTVVMSSMPGQKSIRGVFIPLLAQQLEKRRKDDDIFKIIMRVCGEMSSNNNPQTPLVMGTLKAQFCPAQDWRSYRHKRQLDKVVTALTVLELDEKTTESQDQSAEEVAEEV